jgi:hypothetical protein
MPLVEVIQTRQISASIRPTDSTATQVDQFAAFVHAAANAVVEQALAYVFSKGRDFRDFLKTPRAKEVSSMLRIRRGQTSETSKPPAKEPASKTPSTVVTGIKT